MRITKAAEYRVLEGPSCRVIGGDAAHGAFRGDAQTGVDGVLTVGRIPRTKGAAGSECFVSRASKIMYS
jgi:hypothetical protein